MNNKQRVQWTFSVALIALILAGCGGAQSAPPTAASTPVPGIGAPLAIEGIPLRVTSVTRQATYEASFQQKFVPTFPTDECLIVKAAVQTDDPEKLRGWKVSITDENGRASFPNMTSTEMDAQGTPKSLMWLLVVAKASRSFTLHLPGGQTVQLDTLLASPPAPAPGSQKIAGASPAASEPQPTPLPAKPIPSPTPAKIVLTATAATIAIPYCKEAQAKGSISGNTYVCLSSEIGDYLGGGEAWLLTPADGAFSSTGYGHTLIVEVGKGQGSWHFEFAPPMGQSLKAGLYDNASMIHSSGPDINISGDSKGCDAGRTTGKFEVLEAVYTMGNPSTLERLAVNFEYQCGGGTAPLWGALRFNSTVAP
jgi:hypothetical protein